MWWWSNATLGKSQANVWSGIQRKWSKYWGFSKYLIIKTLLKLAELYES